MTIAEYAASLIWPEAKKALAEAGAPYLAPAETLIIKRALAAAFTTGVEYEQAGRTAPSNVDTP